MKVILSRKGFDSSFGGYPSLILGNKLISLPIPYPNSFTYNQLRFEEKTYYEIMSSIRKNIRYNKNLIEITPTTTCHLDPDLEKATIKRTKDWKPSFGQVGHSQTHLENHNIKEGDFFLFFGWFKEAEEIGGKYYFKKNSPDLHVIYGYLQIGEIIKTATSKIPLWLEEHPHCEHIQFKNNNTIYIGREKLSFDSSMPGAGIFNFNEKRVLTKKGLSRSKWNLPDFFRNVKISRHSENSWKEDYFKSVEIGQEFIIEENEKVTEWVKKLFRD